MERLFFSEITEQSKQQGKLHCIVLRYVLLHCAALRCVALHWVASWLGIGTYWNAFDNDRKDLKSLPDTDLLFELKLVFVYEAFSPSAKGKEIVGSWQMISKLSQNKSSVIIVNLTLTLTRSRRTDSHCKNQKDDTKPSPKSNFTNFTQSVDALYFLLLCARDSTTRFVRRLVGWSVGPLVRHTLLFLSISFL